jgi:putative FmdB family regulatory protein
VRETSLKEVGSVFHGCREIVRMPTYEYECQECGKTFEKFHKMTEKPRVKCPHCGGKTKKLIGTGAGIIFKGEGFYATDYRSKEYKEAKKKEVELPPELKSELKDKSKSKSKKED